MVPNPFRPLARILPGGGGRGRGSSEDAPDEEPPGESSSEADADADALDSRHEGPGADEDPGDRPDPDDAERDAGDAEQRSEADEGGTGSRGPEDLSDTPAPSIGPHTTFKREDPKERLARHEQSDVDAMGLDKRREVVGGSYGPSLARQATLYGAFLLVVGLLVVGAILAVNEFDQPPENEKLEAPWKGTTDPARPPQIDFPRESAPRQVPEGPDATDDGAEA